MLLLNKRSYEMLRMPIYKQALFFANSGAELKRRRIGIWKNILHLNTIDVDYNDYKNKVMEDSSLIKNVEEVIRLDV